MTDSIEPGDVTRFNRKVPAEVAGDRLTSQTSIKDFMDENMDGYLSENAREAFSEMIADRREQAEGRDTPDVDAGDSSYDPGDGDWR